MRLLSIRLPDDLDRKLAAEARRTKKTRSLLAREAIDAFLLSRQRAEVDRLLRKAARLSTPGDVEVAEEALPYDNEALEEAEGRPTGDPWPPKWWR